MLLFILIGIILMVIVVIGGGTILLGILGGIISGIISAVTSIKEKIEIKRITDEKKKNYKEFLKKEEPKYDVEYILIDSDFVNKETPFVKYIEKNILDKLHQFHNDSSHLQHSSESYTGKTDVTAPVSCAFSM